MWLNPWIRDQALVTWVRELGAKRSSGAVT
jgi:hypothetical protein